MLLLPILFFSFHSVFLFFIQFTSSTTLRFLLFTFSSSLIVHLLLLLWNSTSSCLFLYLLLYVPSFNTHPACIVSITNSLRIYSLNFFLIRIFFITIHYQVRANLFPCYYHNFIL